jgi:hypothetical protein
VAVTLKERFSCGGQNREFWKAQEELLAVLTLICGPQYSSKP